MPHPVASAFASLGPDVTPAQVIRFHRNAFGAALMSAEKTVSAAGVEPQVPSEPEQNTHATTGVEDSGKGGKAAVLADLAGERRKRQELEQTVAQLRSGLTQALGIDEKDAEKGDLTSVVATLTEQVAEMATRTAVERLARQHGITADDDIDLLMSVTDETARARMAARIAPGPSEDPKGGAKTPRPDPSQGKGGNDGAVRPTSVAQVMADLRAAREGAK